MLQSTASFWKISCTEKIPFLTFQSQTGVGNKLNNRGFMSPQVLSNPPVILSSVRITCDLHFLNEKFGEKLEALGRN